MRHITNKYDAHEFLLELVAFTLLRVVDRQLFKSGVAVSEAVIRLDKIVYMRSTMKDLKFIIV